MEVTDVTKAIEAGELDPHLGAVIQAAVDRAPLAESTFCWRISIDGDEWTEESMTLGEWVIAQQIASTPMAKIDPRVSASHLVAVLVAHLVKTRDMTLEDAVKQAESYPTSALPGMLSTYQVVNAPKDDGARTESKTS